MRKFNVEIGKKLKLESMVYRVEANSKREAIKKVKELGFNSGERLSSTYSGDFEPIVFDEIK